MILVEHFVSINGEGRKAGELALFLRFKGCNLKCSWCDTAWANEKDCPGSPVSTEQLCALAKSEGVKNITLTGGEPLLQEGIGELICALGKEGFEVEIETNGSVPLPDGLMPRPSYTMDYKLPGSGMENRMCLENFEKLTSEDTVKFVCASSADLEKAREITDKYKLAEKCKVYLSPVFGSIDPAEMAEYMKKHQMNGVRLGLQLHKIIWDPNARGV